MTELHEIAVTVYVSLSPFISQALHKISLRDSVCTARVSSSLLSLISLLVDLGVLADANRRRRMSEAAAVAAAKARVLINDEFSLSA